AARLKTIDVQANGKRIRAYKLTYQTTSATSRSLLSSVQQYGNDAVLDLSGLVTGGSSLPPTTASYLPEANGSFATQPVHTVEGTGSWDGYQGVFADANGDGKADMCVWSTWTGGWVARCALSKGDGGRESEVQGKL